MRKLLVANRGEIAMRVFRACRELGIATVAVAPADDRGSLHARSADETVEIPSYLDPEAVVRAAQESGSDAVHPGYGFLAESPELAAAVEGAGLVWVAPTARRRRSGPPPPSPPSGAGGRGRPPPRSRARSATAAPVRPSSCSTARISGSSS